MPKKFVIIGAAGYIGARHIEAIHNIKGELVAVCDPSDSIGIIDKYFDNTKYFRTIEELDKFLSNKLVDYFVVCTPNYLHFSHIGYGLANNMNVICEKPLVIEPKDIDKLKEIEAVSKGKVYPILQARNHPKILEIKKLIDVNENYTVYAEYMSHRSDWYNKSWKGDKAKSGGALLNIGIHLFDVLCFLFGTYTDLKKTTYNTARAAAGSIPFKHAIIEWKFSLNKEDIKEGNVRRYLKIGAQEIEFSEGFSQLHTSVYERIMADDWYGIEDARHSIMMAHDYTKDLWKEA